MPSTTNIERVDCWRHRGRIGVASSAVCFFQQQNSDGHTLLAAVEALFSQPVGYRVLLRFPAATRPDSIHSLELIHAPLRSDLQVLRVRFSQRNAAIELTLHGFPLLINGLQQWLSGAEDFGISARHSDLPTRQLSPAELAAPEIWFWGPTYLGP